MGKLNWLILLLIVTALVGGYLYRQNTAALISAQREQSSSATLSSPDKEQQPRTLEGAVRVGSAGSATPELRLREVAPTAEIYREEARRNPHLTPPSLIEFAGKIAPQMESALASPERARKFLAELQHCVEARDIATPAQAVCLQNAQRIFRKYPELDSQYRALLNGASPQARELVGRLAKLTPPTPSKAEK